MLNFNQLQQWLQYTELGREILNNEQVFYHKSVHHIFGYYALQVGIEQINFLTNNKISYQYIANKNIRYHTNYLPFATNSIDLILCPHTLEIIPDYYDFLQECYRVLIPRGKIIITNFNKASLLGLFSHKNDILKQINYIKLDKLKSQLKTLNFQIRGGQYFSYKPPLENKEYLQKLNFLDKIGDRWFPSFANCYAITASKELAAPTMITPTAQLDSAKAMFEPNLSITTKADLY